eukprot:1476249-Rhodomonas_salina.1
MRRARSVCDEQTAAGASDPHAVCADSACDGQHEQREQRGLVRGERTPRGEQGPAQPEHSKRGRTQVGSAA